MPNLKASAMPPNSDRQILGRMECQQPLLAWLTKHQKGIFRKFLQGKKKTGHCELSIFVLLIPTYHLKKRMTPKKHIVFLP